MSRSSLFLRHATVKGGFFFKRSESTPFMYPLHKHDDHGEMLLIVEGNGEFEIDGNTYTAGPGTLLLYQRGIWHKEQSTHYPFKALYIGYQGLEIRGLPRDFLIDPQKPPIIRLEEHIDTIQPLMLQCMDEMKKTAPESQLIADHLLGISFVLLARIVHYDAEPECVRKPTQEAVFHARRYIEENYRNELTLETLARATYVNAYHLAHLFKAEVGISPIQYLIRYRMEVAKQYLSTTEMSVKEIGELVGYQSETYFYNLFKKITGQTPGGYRKSN